MRFFTLIKIVWKINFWCVTNRVLTLCLAGATLPVSDMVHQMLFFFSSGANYFCMFFFGLLTFGPFSFFKLFRFLCWFWILSTMHNGGVIMAHRFHGKFDIFRKTLCEPFIKKWEIVLTSYTVLNHRCTWCWIGSAKKFCNIFWK